MSHPAFSIEQDGRTWLLYGCQYDTADGVFGFYIYAISHEHAVAMVEELKLTAVVTGQIVGAIGERD